MTPTKKSELYSPGVKLSKLCVLVLCSVALITEEKQCACGSQLQTLSLESHAQAGSLLSPR